MKLLSQDEEQELESALSQLKDKYDQDITDQMQRYKMSRKKQYMRST